MFSAWTKYGGLTSSINFVSPILGSGSLQMVGTGDSQMESNEDSLYTHGLQRGIIRSLFRVDAAGTGENLCGISYLQSVQNMLTTGHGLFVGYKVVGSSSPNSSVVIVAQTYGFSGSGGFSESPTTIYTSSAFTLTYGTTIGALQVEWELEPTVLSAIRIIISEGHGLLTDFSNLVPLTTLEITSSEVGYSTSHVSESLYFKQAGSGSATFQADSSRISSLE